MKIEKTDALIAVDVQNDFCSGGALEVKDGDSVVEPLNVVMKYFDTIVATQDWHPKDHCSFKDSGGSWPSHCIQDSVGAGLHGKLNHDKITYRIHKGSRQDKDAYSGFDGTELSRKLKEDGIERVFIGGLATDYCVKATALDAIEGGFETYVLEDAVRAVETEKGDSRRALEEIRKHGGKIIKSIDLE